MGRVDEYNDILTRYRNGEFGKNILHLNEILEKAGRPTLLNEMSIDELNILAESSYGFLRWLFLTLAKSKEGN